MNPAEKALLMFVAEKLRDAYEDGQYFLPMSHRQELEELMERAETSLERTEGQSPARRWDIHLIDRWRNRE